MHTVQCIYIWFVLFVLDTFQIENQNAYVVRSMKTVTKQSFIVHSNTQYIQTKHKNNQIRIIIFNHLIQIKQIHKVINQPEAYHCIHACNSFIVPDPSIKLRIRVKPDHCLVIH